MIKALLKLTIFALEDLTKAIPSFYCAPITPNKYLKSFNIAIIADWLSFLKEVILG
jgi:hypothetical protein